MRADELKTIIDRRPFQPIRLSISSGETVDITHPDLAIVSRSLVAVGVRPSARHVADFIVHYNLLHVVKITPLNGARRRRSG